MKKVLFATTALVASAGIASAQGVNLSGSAEMGISGGTDLETQFHHDIDVTFTLSGETDNGLTFGATIDLDEINNSTGAFDPNGGGSRGASCVAMAPAAACRDRNLSSVFVSGAFGTLTMGDTDGAFDWALQDLDIIGDISDANTSHIGFNGNAGLDGQYDGQIARYDYSFGDFSFAASVEQDDSAVVGDPVFGIGGKYSGDLGGVTLGVGLGYQTNGNIDLIGVSVDASMDNGLRAVLNYTDYSGGPGVAGFDPASVIGVDSHVGVGLFYSMDAISVGVHYGQYDLTAGGQNSGVGLVATYDLGGGAVMQFGYSTSDPAVGASTDLFSLGVAMSF